jgi:nicotinate phosphoribosyltransferase
MSPWVTADELALVTDQYQLTMLQAYWREGLDGEATFTLYVRSLPPSRNFLLAAGLEDALGALESLRFSAESLDYLSTLGVFARDFLEWLAGYRFQGEVRAVPEGTPVFAEEPILEVTGPLPQAQLVETLLMNQLHFQTLAASKGARVALAAGGRPVVDFGLRRIHGADAGLKGARAFYIGGLAATSHLLAGKVYGIPVSGTMAHSYVQAHPDEESAFRAFAALYPGTTLLVDTYDTLEAVRTIVRLARELGDAFRPRGIRLDSGDLVALAGDARRLLDEGGLTRVEIFASGGLDEHEIARMLEAGAPLDGFGVGTRMSVSRDAPSLDMAYKLTAYAGEGRIKLSRAKPLLPGRKQVFRVEEDGKAVRDVVALEGEEHPGRPLLRTVMRGGHTLPGASPPLADVRAYAAEQIATLPARLRSLSPAAPPYPVEISAGLRRYHHAVARQFTPAAARAATGDPPAAGPRG